MKKAKQAWHAVISAGGSRLCLSRPHAHDPPLACIASFLRSSPQIFEQKRDCSQSMSSTKKLLVTSENICFFIDFDSRLSSEALLKFEGYSCGENRFYFCTGC